MAIKKIVTYGHPSLRKISPDITDFSDIDSLIQDLFDTMYANDGVGLAANQININKRIFVVRLLSETADDEELVFINGKITPAPDIGYCINSEGCLSLPGVRLDVERYKVIGFTYLDRNLKECSDSFSGPLARVIQHENDHLDGKLITDYATPADLLKYGKALELMREENTK